ncbi:hypothetical protein ACFV9C_44525 [Kribbella sp. NPDC059898]|uniref:hypothetical protein n=1 Tax=Kribbella sp. NPDC059898 TaxID=3346995 RepID=UPI00364DD5E4
MDQVRFSARPGFGGGFGVHDSVSGDWCTPATLVEQVAVEFADDLNAREAATGHPIEEVRYGVPKRVQRASWAPAGTIDVWVYDTNSKPPQWIGRVRDEAGGVEWCPGADLRPADGPVSTAE